MLRLATKDDSKLIEVFLEELLTDSKYKLFFKDHKFTTDIIDRFLEDPDQSVIVLLLNGDKEIGLGAFELIPCLYTPFSMARVAAIYIKPEYRGKGHMDEILGSFEYWGKMVGATYYNIGVSTGADLSNRGYQKYEVMFMKEVE